MGSGEGENKGGEDVTMATHFHLIPRLRMSGVSWRAYGKAIPSPVLSIVKIYVRD
jgi:diadenosine tetraphosphate (Ap4A) HIT family hydrolase